MFTQHQLIKKHFGEKTLLLGAKKTDLLITLDEVLKSKGRTQEKQVTVMHE